MALTPTFVAAFMAALHDLLPVALLAGVAGLDVVSFPQIMISRPIVAATMAGALLGAPFAGLICGATLECLALEALPVGASRYPEWGSASVVAGAVAAQGAGLSALPRPGAFTVAIAIGIAAAWLGGWTMVRHRQLIARAARPRLDRIANGDRDAMLGLQLFGMTADLARGTLLGAVLFPLACAAAIWCDGRWATPADVTRGVVVAVVAAVAASAVWKDFHAISGTRRLFLLSLTVGTALVVMGA